MQGVAHTQYQWNGVTYTRDLLVSKPDEVTALHLKADKPGTLSFTAALVRRHDATARVDGGLHVLERQLPFNKPGGDAGRVGDRTSEGGEGMRFTALLGASVEGGEKPIVRAVVARR